MNTQAATATGTLDILIATTEAFNQGLAKHPKAGMSVAVKGLETWGYRGWFTKRAYGRVQIELRAPSSRALRILREDYSALIARL